MKTTRVAVGILLPLSIICIVVVGFFAYLLFSSVDFNGVGSASSFQDYYDKYVQSAWRYAIGAAVIQIIPLIVTLIVAAHGRARRWPFVVVGLVSFVALAWSMEFALASRAIPESVTMFHRFPPTPPPFAQNVTVGDGYTAVLSYREGARVSFDYSLDMPSDYDKMRHVADYYSQLAGKYDTSLVGDFDRNIELADSVHAVVPLISTNDGTVVQGCDRAIDQFRQLKQEHPDIKSDAVVCVMKFPNANSSHPSLTYTFTIGPSHTDIDF